MSNENIDKTKESPTAAQAEEQTEKHSYVISDLYSLIEESKNCDVLEEIDENCNTIELPDPEADARIQRIKDEAIAEYEAKKAEEAKELERKKSEERKSLRKTFSSCGWSVLLLMGIWMGLTLGVSVVAGIIEGLGDSGLIVLQTSPMDIYMKYYLIINEVTLLVAVFIASLLLKTKEPVKVEKRGVAFGKFLMLFPICFAISTAGNLISNTISMFSGSAEEIDELTQILSSTNVWIAFICTGIVAPIIEELFFRKMLIDRLRPHGEMVCLIVPSLFFALFHQNVGQLFYTFGLGLLFSHLYYHSGRCSLTIILHAVFNTIGTIPILFYDTIFELEDALYLVIDGAASPEILYEFIVPIIIYLVYALVLFALAITGIILICTNYKKIKISKSESVLSPAEQRAVFFKTPGIIISLIVTGILTLASL